VRAALVSEPDWREAVAAEHERGADLICLPHLSFAPYIAASRNRGGLEYAERPPSSNVREAARLAPGAWIAASAYESEGEGVFYVTGYLAGPETLVASSRQRTVEARPGRYEQMFWSPGHEPPVAARLSCGSAVVLLGADVRCAAPWAAVAGLGVSHVICGCSEPPETWETTRRLVAGMAALHRLTALVANRGDQGFAGESAAFGVDGSVMAPGSDGLYEL
jgi:predicted amidohydrolase